tara:strand:- start:47 stop:295 length:249 start_codon:yes stop_codon:yes gene_type:complete
MRPFIGMSNMSQASTQDIELEVHDDLLGCYAQAYYEKEEIKLPSGNYRVVGAAKRNRRGRSTEVYLHLCAPVFECEPYYTKS